MTDDGAASTQSAPLVLLIDDAEDLRRAIADLLQLNGFRVATARNGFEGIRMAVELTPDVILMDLAMPGMDGLETARILKRQTVTSTIPVAAFTGQTVLDDVDRIRRKGFTALISKSHSPAELLAAVRQILKASPVHEDQVE